MKSFGVIVQMKPLQQYFHHIVLFIFNVVLTFQSVHENLWCHHSKNISSAVLSHIIIRSSVSVPKILISAWWYLFFRVHERKFDLLFNFVQ